MRQFKIKPGLPKLRTRQAEINGILKLCATADVLLELHDTSKQRLEAIPGGYQLAWRLIGGIRELLTDLISTVPDEKLPQLRRALTGSTYYFGYDQFTRGVRPEYIPIKAEYWDRLVQEMHDFRCTGCDKDCNHCEYSKILDAVCVQCRRKNESWSNIDLTVDLGEEDVV